MHGDIQAGYRKAVRTDPPQGSIPEDKPLTADEAKAAILSSSGPVSPGVHSPMLGPQPVPMCFPHGKIPQRSHVNAHSSSGKRSCGQLAAEPSAVGWACGTSFSFVISRSLTSLTTLARLTLPLGWVHSSFL